MSEPDNYRNIQDDQSQPEPPELVWETGIADNEPPQKTLWRVMSIRPWRGREIRHTNWFATEDAARAHAAWIEDGRGRVVSLLKYRLEEEPRHD